ncbi:phosphoribosylaminoimidazole carboxylase ade2 [Nowakowskiella sp. JEL0078]|nr:phosphoribosylaminoimidazole carboxylase ade2 [Nowakowskiella sp. JEL0078]
MDAKVVGVLGGGQLGRMLIEAANRLQITVAILDDSSAPAAELQRSSPHVTGSFRNADDILQLAKKTNLLTVEIEHVDVAALEKAQAQTAIPIHPSPQTIRTIQDKFLQKQYLTTHRIPVAEYEEVSQNSAAEDIYRIAETENNGFGYPIMLKTRKLAYDGRGNRIIKNKDDVTSALSDLGHNSSNLSSPALYVEKMVNFTRELAVMVVRSVDGEVKSYPAVETIQKNNVCHVVIAPATVSTKIAESARRVAEDAIKVFDGAGIFGVEMFLLKSGEVLVNEIAPRPHNSGHYTLDACETSQFENHLRAICGLPLGSTKMKVPCSVMVNVLGISDNWEDSLIPCVKALQVPGATVHLYGKKDSRQGRKIAHINFVGDDFVSLFGKVDKILDVIEGPSSRITVLNAPPVVGIIMGSDSDLRIMSAAVEMMKKFGVPHECTVVSAHRTPERMFQYAKTAHERGIKVIVAGAGGAAHLPGMVAAISPLPVIGVPIALSHFNGQDSLLSIVQMPRGVPVATVAVDNAQNAGLLAIRILATQNSSYMEKMIQFQSDQEKVVMGKVDIMKESFDNEFDS